MVDVFTANDGRIGCAKCCIKGREYRDSVAGSRGLSACMVVVIHTDDTGIGDGAQLVDIRIGVQVGG